VDLGLLVTALSETRERISGAMRDRMDALLAEQSARLMARVGSDGWVPMLPGAGKQTWSLAAQTAAIRGLVASYEASFEPATLDAAMRAYEALNAALWVEDLGFGLYATGGDEDALAYCYTPLEMGLLVGALRELALRQEEDDAADMVARLAACSRSIVDDAALQLSNVIAANDVALGTGAGTIAGLRLAVLDAPDGLAPVLQQRLCLETTPTDSVCGGVFVEPEDPLYRTDIAMYAAYVAQAQAPELEDYADANLAALVIHSGLGIPFSEFDRLLPVRSFIDGALGRAGDGGWNPIAIPYAGGDPELRSAGSLAWRASGFDARILASAIGMTLLREAQEIRQLLDRPAEDLQAMAYRTALLAAALESLNALQAARVVGPERVEYVPHEVRRTIDRGWTAVIEDVRLFDQLSLLWGVAEVYGLLSDARASAGPLQSEVADARSVARSLLNLVLSTMEDVLLVETAAGAVLVEAARPEAQRWQRSTSVSTTDLGLASSALQHVVTVLGTAAPESVRAVALVERLEAYLRAVLWDGSGGYRERIDLEAAEEGCVPQSLAGQLGAVRLLLAADALGVGTDAGDRAVAAFHLIDERFWSTRLGAYRSQAEAVGWCVTPLEFGLAVDTLTRIADRVSTASEDALRERLRQHSDRILDAVQLQLPARVSANGATGLTAAGSATHYAPVFARERCLRSWEALRALGYGVEGDVIRYTIEVDNPTERAFANLQLEDILPDGVSYLESRPQGSVVGGTVGWSFPSLDPGERRHFELLAATGPETPRGEELVNCARLRYTDLEGVPQPEREDCAGVRIVDDEWPLGAPRGAVDVRYLTDEAMALSTTLDEIGCRWSDHWTTAARARELSVANLGVLLGESALGTPLPSAAAFADEADRGRAALDQLAVWSAQSGLPGVPGFGAPIVIPFVSGTPWLVRGEGFVARREAISPAAVGQTLAREARFLTDCDPQSSSLEAYLERYVTFLVEEQIRWVDTVLGPAPDGGGYVPRLLEPQGQGMVMGYVPVDARSVIYHEAALLLGLLRASSVVAEGSRELATGLASILFTHLQRHWNAERGVLDDALFGAGEPREATWLDAAVFVDAVAAVHAELPALRGQAEALLQSVAGRALNTAAVLDVAEEAARVRCVARIAELLGDSIILRYADDAANAWREAFIDPLGRGEPLSPRTGAGWTETPRRLAAILQLLDVGAERQPGERNRWLTGLTRIVESEIVATRVQLVPPMGIWTLHTYVPCEGLAAVFAAHSGLRVNLPEPE
jgi:uncharacterized repeat protein (TIGR01451 family)